MTEQHNSSSRSSSSDSAVEAMRRKVAAAYGTQPSSAQTQPGPSKHQQYMQELSKSGRSLAEIQTAWHQYYTTLTDREKHEVWREFYATNHTRPDLVNARTVSPSSTSQSKQQPGPHPTVSVQPMRAMLTMANGADDQEDDDYEEEFLPKKPSIKQRVSSGMSGLAPIKAAGNFISNHFSVDTITNAKQNIRSLAFGLVVGAIVLVVFLFGFFNEYIITPFIQPSRKVTSAPIIMTDQVAETAMPTVIVPKINVQIPIDFNVPSIDEATVQASLEGGVVHYPSTALPGQNGNGAYFGHSSQNIFNNGKYKFAFVLLHQLTTGDVFYVTYDGKVYAYQVFAKEIVPPTQVSVLNDTKGKTATAVLITCDPPGFSTNRLVVWGEQISPNISLNTEQQPTSVSDQPAQLTSKGPSWWSQLQFWRRD